MKRLSLRVLIGSVAVSAVLGIYALLAGDFGDFEIRILLTTLCVSGASILSMACGAAWERGQLAPLPAVGIGLAVLAAASATLGIWGEFNDEVFWKSTGSFTILATACGHVSMLSMARPGPRHRWVLRATQVVGALLTLLLLVMLWGEIDEEGAFRAVGVLAILLTSGTILAPVLHRLAGQSEDQESGPALVEVRHCPRCGQGPVGPAGQLHCAGCGATFRVEFLPG